jgi:hypothetical protein
MSSGESEIFVVGRHKLRKYELFKIVALTY